jgi:two-component system, cell cycle response regulator
MQIVLVEPSRAVQRIMAQLIEPADHEVLAFGSGHEGLDCIASKDGVRALITSAELSDMSGIELCGSARLLSGSKRPLYIILMSSLDKPDLIVRALDNGADDFIHKPPNAQELRARLRTADRVTTVQSELIKRATTDYLTGLLNRRAFFDRAVEICERAEAGNAVSAIVFDIDHFKQVNDSQGHETGDVVLAHVAAEAKAIDGLVARLGGEEFCVLGEYDILDAIEVAEDLRRAIKGQRFGGSNAFGVTCSFGVSEWEKCDTIDQLLRRADIALYEAKNTGRDRVVASDSFRLTRDHDAWRGVARTGKRHD